MAVLQENKDEKKNFVIEEIFVRGYEKVVKIVNKKAKLKAIIAIHSTRLGPAFGGTRIYPYKNFQSALNDVLRLSKGMTYKSAVANSGFGGGKSVIIARSKEKTKDMLFAFAEAVNFLKGRYICAEDVGCNIEDVAVFKEKTKYVAGLLHENGSGDPSRFTAWGVIQAMKAVLNKLYKKESFKGVKIAVQGVGNVGKILVEKLFWLGADIIVCDVDDKKVKEVVSQYQVKPVEVEKIYDEKCDIFAPCAMGGVINDHTINRLKCRAVAGSANNQLMQDYHADILLEKKILYATDFVINSGGLINAALEMEKDGYKPNVARERTENIYNTLTSIMNISEKNKISMDKAAKDLAKYRLKFFIGKRNRKVYFHH